MNLQKRMIFVLTNINTVGESEEAVREVGYGGQGWEVIAASTSPAQIVEALRYWVELNSNWPKKLREQTLAEITALRAAGHFQVNYAFKPGGEDVSTWPLVLQFGYMDAGC